VILFAETAGIPLFPDEASTQAAKVDTLFFFIFLITGGVGLLVTLLMTVFGIRYRRRGLTDRTPRIMGWPLLEWSWIIAPLLIFAVMFGWGVSTFCENFQPPADAPEVFVVGKQWMWKIQHPDGRREIDELHLPVGRPVKMTLISEDVIHDFAVPAFRSKIDVLPGRYVSTWYLPTKVGRFHLFCNQYCGTAHAEMRGTVIVMQPEEYAAWLREKVDGSPAVEGRKLFLKLQCINCHSADAVAHAPVLEGLYGRHVTLKGGNTVLADYRYLRDSILLPGKEVVEGFESIMPTFQGQVSEEEVLQLIAFIRSLGKGDTPRRNNNDPAPIGTPNAGATGEAGKK
jgi:cytochrome c oxidase subunit 2